MNVIPLSVVFLLATLAVGGLAFTTTDVLYQSLYVGAASASFAVFLGLVAVNIILNSTDRKRAAAPLLKLVMSLAEQQHNELFIKLGWDHFGADRFGELIDIYQRNKGSPEAFSPEDLSKLYSMIVSKRAELTALYTQVEMIARDMAFILGWGYDVRVLAPILSIRTDAASFIRIISNPSHDQAAKKKLVEHYFDIDGAMHAWAQALAQKLGVQISD